MRRAICSLLFASMLTVATTAFGGAAPDPFAGTWILDLTKSTFKPGPAPFKSQTRVITVLPDGMQMNVESVMADGSKATGGGTFRFDGRNYPFTGFPAADGISMVRRGDLLMTGEGRRKTDQVMRYTFTMAEDRRQLTIWAKGLDEKEQPVDSTLVFRRK